MEAGLRECSIRGEAFGFGKSSASMAEAEYETVEISVDKVNNVRGPKTVFRCHIESGASLSFRMSRKLVERKIPGVFFFNSFGIKQKFAELFHVYCCLSPSSGQLFFACFEFLRIFISKNRHLF